MSQLSSRSCHSQISVARATGGNRTLFLSLPRICNNQYTTAAGPPTGTEPVFTLYERVVLPLHQGGIAVIVYHTTARLVKYEVKEVADDLQVLYRRYDML